KILEDFGNFSYRIELPTHLKRRGVHDVFHASYLRVHQPNDDRLFPGWLDTQLGSQDAPDGEWAVEWIEGHVGARNDATFKVRWRSGDITWMPYYQIKHLHALGLYFELLGIKQIDELPRSVNSNMFQPKIDSEGLAMNNLKDSPSNEPPSSSNLASTSTLTLNSIHYSTMPQPIDHSALSHIHLAKLSDNHFTLSNPNDTTHVISFSTTELRKYIDYD
ncbi:hypothetical protein L208DRAFT_1536585, partial [Tricholoma matsutake]